MRDEVALHINGQMVENFTDYRVESNLFLADDAFEFTLASPRVTVAAGDMCKLYVNGVLELTGIIDAAPRSFSKFGRFLKLRGRDLMGLLTDTHVEEFVTYKDYTLKQLAEKLLAKVPYINRKSIIYGKGNKNRAVPLTKEEETFEFVQIHPGKTVFDSLKEYALSQGMLFFSLPDGTFVFGEPRTSGAPEFLLTVKKSGRGNNVLEGEIADDLSRRFSKVVITGQRQGTDIFAPEEINVSGTATDKTFPFYKPFVGAAVDHGQNPERYAQILMDKQRFEGFTLKYKTPGHSINGRNLTINAVAKVEDEALNVSGNFLIYERILEMSKQGVFTSLKLSHLGVLPA